MEPIHLFLLLITHRGFVGLGVQTLRQFPQPIQLRHRFLIAEARIFDPKQGRVPENHGARLNGLQPQLPFDRRAQHGHLGVDVSLLAGRRSKRVRDIGPRARHHRAGQHEPRATEEQSAPTGGRPGFRFNNQSARDHLRFDGLAQWRDAREAVTCAGARAPRRRRSYRAHASGVAVRIVHVSERG